MLYDNLPNSFGVYLMKDKKGQVVYVGKAKNVKERVRQYFVPGRDTRAQIPYLVAEVDSIDFILVTSEKEALLLENNLIKKHWPKYNALLKDDKSYCSLSINHKHLWPMVRIVRYKGKPPSNQLYFGPYTNGWAARETLELIRTLFPLRQCSDRELVRRTRPCILHGLKKCIAPCVSLCTKEEYDLLVKKVIDFLQGHDKKILKELSQEMKEASEKLEYEKAALLLKKIRNIELTLEKQRVEIAGMLDLDVLSLYREGGEVTLVKLEFREGKLMGAADFSFSHNAQEEEDLISSFILQYYDNQEFRPKEVIVPIPLKAEGELSSYLHLKVVYPHRGNKVKLLEMAKKNAVAAFQKERTRGKEERLLLSLEEKLHLTNFPERIECFDTSHISGVEPVSAMVSFVNGAKESSSYRKYKIVEANPSDDYGALREVLYRRFSKAKESGSLPDLLLIDGGKGHLNIAKEVLLELDITTIDLVAIAKERSLHTKGLTEEKIYLLTQEEPLLLPKESPLLHLLQKIRDEAHRFVLTFQKVRRKKHFFKSALDGISGIGPVKKKRLLSHFGSPERIWAATDEELRSIPGIQQKDIDALRKKQL